MRYVHDRRYYRDPEEVDRIESETLRFIYHLSVERDANGIQKKCLLCAYRMEVQYNKTVNSFSSLVI